MLTVKNVQKSYATKMALENVSIAFPEQRITALIGPNGAGKSTLLMLMARLLSASKGAIFFKGQRIDRIRIAEYARHVATLRQSLECNLRLTVEELVAFGRFPHSRGVLTRADRRAIDEALAFLSLEELRGAFIDQLSGGQRQLAFLAMTIAQQTECVLLDEPLNNLDMKHAVQIMQALRRLCDTSLRTIIVVIHDINFAANYSDHIVAMKGGAIHSSGSVEEVITAAGLKDLYRLEFEIMRSSRGLLCNYFTPQEG